MVYGDVRIIGDTCFLRAASVRGASKGGAFPESAAVLERAS
jgi:hypothetical protein